MNASDAIGRKIVAMRQERYVKSVEEGGGVAWYVKSITLDNGTTIVFNVDEIEGDYGVTASLVRRERKTNASPS